MNFTIYAIFVDHECIYLQKIAGSCVKIKHQIAPNY